MINLHVLHLVSNFNLKLVRDLKLKFSFKLILNSN